MVNDERIMDVNHPDWTSFINKLYSVYICRGCIHRTTFMLSTMMLSMMRLSPEAIKASLKQFKSNGHRCDCAVLRRYYTST